jgi:elongation factor P
MANTSDIRNGMIIEYNNGIYEVIDFLHVKPGKGGAFVRTKMKNIRTGQVIDNTFRTSEKLTEVRIEKTKNQYLYREGDLFNFMDIDTYEQLSIPKDAIGDLDKFLMDGMEAKIRFTPDKEVIGIEIPIVVEQLITECEPNVKGNTASGSGKVAFTETGLRIIVPFFVEAGTKIRIDTRTGEYIERA